MKTDINLNLTKKLLPNRKGGTKINRRNNSSLKPQLGGTPLFGKKKKPENQKAAAQLAAKKAYEVVSNFGNIFVFSKSKP